MLLHVEDVLVFLQERVGTFVENTLALTLFYSFSFSVGWGDQQFWFRLVSVDVRDQVFEPVR